jgi:tetratricopeptide (TPR) repeat protein
VNSIKIITISIICIFIFHCGENIEQQADKAFKEGKYTQVIKLLSEEYKNDTTNYSFAEKIALSYLLRGDLLFKKTGNVEALKGNIKEAKDYFPKNPSDSLKTNYSKILYNLAEHYMNTKAKNVTEAEDFYHQAVVALKEALVQDSTNSDAKTLMVKIKDKHFQRLIDKAKSLYSKGERTRDVELYFSAEYYLNNAAEFDPDNYEIKLYRSRIKRKRLGVLDYRDGLSFAIMNYRQERQNFIMHLAIKNYLSDSVAIRLDNFELVSIKGDTFQVNKREIKARKLFGDKCIENTTLNRQNRYTEGIIVFLVPKDSTDISYLAYKMNNNRVVRKYFR